MGYGYGDSPDDGGLVTSMRRSGFYLTVLAATWLAVGPATSARAGVFEDVTLGLGRAGFNVGGNRNVASGGADYLVNNIFVGNTLNLGMGDLTLLGPISLSVSSGTRFVNTLDVSLRTAIDGGVLASVTPFSYILNLDSGSQSAAITGSLLIDANFSINGFGFYDFDLRYSSRQSVDREGRVTDAGSDFDSDIGPINISGNIYADILALVTAPFFDAAGTSNPFASFSGSSKLIDALQNDSLLRVLAEGASSDMKDVFPYAATIPGSEGVDVFGTGLGIGVDEAFLGIVPEPTVLLLMLAALPLVFFKRLRQVFSS